MSAAPVIHPAPLQLLFLSKDAIVEQAGITKRWFELCLEQYAAGGGVVIQREIGRARNGKPLREYHVDSLPAAIRAKLQPATPAPVPTPKIEPSPLAIAPLFGNVAEPAAEPVRAILTDPRDVEVATRREQLIRPLLDWEQRKGAYASLRLRNGSQVRTIRALADYLVETSPGDVSWRTLWNWKKAYEQHGLPGLAPKRRVDKGRSKWAAENRSLADLAAHIYMGDANQPPQSATVAWEQVCRYADEVGATRPSYETVRAFLQNRNEVSASMKTLQTKGRRGYDAVFANYLRRSYTEPANQIWVSDHAIVDVLVQDDCFERDLRHCRIQMTSIIDFRSRMIVGVSWTRNGSSHSIKRALLQAITRHGLPEMFYVDNGKDYRKIARGASAAELVDLDALDAATAEDVRIIEGSVMKRLGVEVKFCKPFHPQSKHIERYHRTFHDRVDRAFLSYTAGATHLRRDETVDALVDHKKLVSIGDTRGSKLPLASEYIAMAEAWIFGDYHQRPHSGEGMNGRSPAQCFAEELNPNQRPTPSIEQLVALMAETRRCKVRNLAVEINGVRFVPSALDVRGSAVMHELSGGDERFLVAFDPLSMTQAVVLDEQGYALCTLEAQARTRFADDDETRSQIAAIEQQRGMLHKATKQSIAELGRRVRAAGHKPLAQQLRERAGLSATSTSNLVQKPRKTASGETAAPMYVAQAVDALFGD